MFLLSHLLFLLHQCNSGVVTEEILLHQTSTVICCCHWTLNKYMLQAHRAHILIFFSDSSCVVLHILSALEVIISLFLMKTEIVCFLIDLNTREQLDIEKYCFSFKMAVGCLSFSQFSDLCLP